MANIPIPSVNYKIKTASPLAEKLKLLARAAFEYNQRSAENIKYGNQLTGQATDRAMAASQIANARQADERNFKLNMLNSMTNNAQKGSMMAVDLFKTLGSLEATKRGQNLQQQQFMQGDATKRQLAGMSDRTTRRSQDQGFVQNQSEQALRRALAQMSDVTTNRSLGIQESQGRRSDATRRMLASLSNATDMRGQNLQYDVSKSGQRLQETLSRMRDATTRSGQDMNYNTTLRGQDLSAQSMNQTNQLNKYIADMRNQSTIRGQGMNYGAALRGQDMNYGVNAMRESTSRQRNMLDYDAAMRGLDNRYLMAGSRQGGAGGGGTQVFDPGKISPREKLYYGATAKANLVEQERLSEPLNKLIEAQQTAKQEYEDYVFGEERNYSESKQARKRNNSKGQGLYRKYEQATTDAVLLRNYSLRLGDDSANAYIGKKTPRGWTRADVESIFTAQQLNMGNAMGGAEYVMAAIPGNNKRRMLSYAKAIEDVKNAKSTAELVTAKESLRRYKSTLNGIMNKKISGKFMTTDLQERMRQAALDAEGDQLLSVPLSNAYYSVIQRGGARAVIQQTLGEIDKLLRIKYTPYTQVNTNSGYGINMPGIGRGAFPNAIY